MNIFELPLCVIETILSYLTYDDLAKSRIVCKKFNEINMNLLNRGFYKLITCHGKQLKKIKAQLPRRESERRNHALSRHSDILTCLETRLSMLNMTYQKLMQNGTICFIPGKVIDECFSILRITACKDIIHLRPHEILQELRDISSMAIEHFEEKIVPDIKQAQMDKGLDHSLVSKASFYEFLASSPRPVNCSIESLPFDLSRNSSSSSVSLRERDHRGVATRSKFSSFVKMYKKQAKIIKGQAKQISKMMYSLKHFKRRLDESEIRNREMTESIKQLKASRNPMQADEPLINVKRRTATMILKRRLDQH